MEFRLEKKQTCKLINISLVFFLLFYIVMFLAVVLYQLVPFDWEENSRKIIETIAFFSNWGKFLFLIVGLILILIGFGKLKLMPEESEIKEQKLRFLFLIPLLLTPLIIYFTINLIFLASFYTNYFVGTIILSGLDIALNFIVLLPVLILSIIFLKDQRKKEIKEQKLILPFILSGIIICWIIAYSICTILYFLIYSGNIPAQRILIIISYIWHHLYHLGAIIFLSDLFAKVRRIEKGEFVSN